MECSPNSQTAARRASEGSQMFSDELTSHNTNRNVSRVHAGSCELIWRKRWDGGSGHGEDWALYIFPNEAVVFH